MASSKLPSLPPLCFSALSLSMTKILSRVLNPLNLDSQGSQFYFLLRVGLIQSSVAVGLRILTEISRRDSNVAFSSIIKKFIISTASSKLLSLPLLCFSAISFSMTKILSRVWSPLLQDPQEGHYDYLLRMGLFQSSMAVGLRILTEVSCKDSNVVFSSGLKKSIKPPNSQTNQTRSFSIDHCFQTHSFSVDHCFLKSCFLCNKTLRLDEDVYMYRGDQCFCSEECRSRQIFLDEMKEIEISTSRKLSSIRRCRELDSILVEEHGQRQQRAPLSRQKDRPIFSY